MCAGPFRQKTAALFCGLVTLAGLLLGGCAPVDLLNATIPTANLTIAYDVPYGEGNRRRLDVYAPTAVKDGAPVVIFFYGGNWRTGEKRDYLFAAQAFASRGIIAVVPDYRTYPGVVFPGFLDDGATATAWAVGHIREWGGDPRKIFLVGHSAGAYIAIMLALNEQYLERAGIPSKILAGAVGLSGPYDFLPIERPDIKPIFEVVPDLSVTQPIAFVHAGVPPLLLAAGDDDQTVDPGNTVRLAARMRAVGATAETHFYPGIGHIGTVTALSPIFRGRAPVLDDIDHFIRETLAHRASLTENPERKGGNR